MGSKQEAYACAKAVIRRQRTSKMQDNATTKGHGITFPMRIAVWVLLYGSAIYFATNGEYVVAMMLVATGIAARMGLHAGAVNIIAFLIAISAAISFAPTLGMMQESRFTLWFGTTGLANRFLCIGIIGLLISMLLFFCLTHLGGRLLRRHPRLLRCNQWFGLVFGAIEGASAVLFFLSALLILEPTERLRANQNASRGSRDSTVTTLILTTAEAIQKSRLGPVLSRYNPFERFPQINRVEQIRNGVDLAIDPRRTHAFMEHPSIKALQRRPEVRKAIYQLNQDRDVQQFLNSNQPFNFRIATALLNHPALMELIDEPGFLENATKAIESASIPALVH